MAAAPPETPSHIEDPLDEMTVGEADTYVEQFRRQLKMTREQVSVVAEAIKSFCQEGLPTDPLIKGMDSKTNPYIEKKDCTIQ